MSRSVAGWRWLLGALGRTAGELIWTKRGAIPAAVTVLGYSFKLQPVPDANCLSTFSFRVLIIFFNSVIFLELLSTFSSKAEPAAKDAPINLDGFIPLLVVDADGSASGITLLLLF